MASSKLLFMITIISIILLNCLVPQTLARRLLSHPPANFPFPETKSAILPEPSAYFATELLSNPLPTNSFFQNFVLNNGDQPEYFHPYQIKSSRSSLTLSYPNRIPTSTSILQNFSSDLTISSSSSATSSRHIISRFTDLALTLDYPSSKLRFFLVRGSPYVTFFASKLTKLSISTVHAITSFSSNDARNKYTLKLSNGQTWLLYSLNGPVGFTNNNPSLITSDEYYGVIRVTLLPGSEVVESILDRYSSCYPVSGEAVLTGEPFSVEYRWEKEHGDLLMLAHPLHVKLLSVKESNVTVLENFKYKSIDGDLVGIVGNSWTLRPPILNVTWHSIKGVKPKPNIVSALLKDVNDVTSTPITKTDTYFYGKAMAKAARLALIAEEVHSLEVIPAITKYLRDAIEPWLDGTFTEDGFLYDAKWGGLVTKNGVLDKGADFGFGVYNDHHYHIGYFLYSMSVLTKMDSAWGDKYRNQAYSLVGDFMSLHTDTKYPKLRSFDLYTLHSWAGGLQEFADGRNQESTSEAVNAYYSAALMGLAYKDPSLQATGSLLTALEIQAAQTWWHVHQGDNVYEDVFASENKVTGVLWSNKRDSGLWFAGPGSRECRLGIQVLPISPITEVLFSNVSYVRELVEWTMPALSNEGVTDAWKGFTYALQGMYNNEEALQKIRNLSGFDDGNSLTNLLWWINSRG